MSNNLLNYEYKMIDILLKSKIRRQIILIFLYNQKQEFYLSEIARMVGTSSGTAQRELNRLLKLDLILFSKKGNLNIYRLNKDFSLLDDFESIVRKTFGIEAELRERLRPIQKISYAFLFGSYVKGGFKSDSDIDLFIIGDVDFDKTFEAVQQVENVVGREINFHVASENEFLDKKKKDYFYLEIIENITMLIGSENEFRKFAK
jgi:predicted nucleotidyltransferase/predicted transcriptional regulator with HTH domain